MNYEHAEWRYLYTQEEGAFARLPWFARAAAAELLKPCDGEGRIEVGDGPEAEACARLVAAVAYRMGATRGDRRLMASLFPLLFAEGYLVARGAYVHVRNFPIAQRRRRGLGGAANEPPPRDDRSSNEPRRDHDATTTAPRSDHDGATKPELSTRNHTAQDPVARARAPVSVPFRSVPTPSVPTQGEEPRAAPDSDARALTREAPARPGPARIPTPPELGVGLVRDASGVIQRAPDAVSLPRDEPRPLALDASTIFDALLRGAGPDRFSPHCPTEIAAKFVAAVRDCRFTEADLVLLGADLRQHMPAWVKSGRADAVVLLGKQRDGAPLMSLMSEAKQRDEHRRRKRDAVRDAATRRDTRATATTTPLSFAELATGIAAAKAAGKAGA